MRSLHGQAARVSRSSLRVRTWLQPARSLGGGIPKPFSNHVMTLCVPDTVHEFNACCQVSFCYWIHLSSFILFPFAMKMLYKYVTYWNFRETHMGLYVEFLRRHSIQIYEEFQNIYGFQTLYDGLNSFALCYRHEPMNLQKNVM